jgi:hypothetical protein
MRLILFALLLTLNSAATEYSPFLEPYNEATTYNGFALNLFRRDGNCGSGISCAAMGDKASCCMSKARCAVDEAGRVGCCPENAQCTGTIGGSAVATATGTPAPSAQITGSGGRSVVSNAYYPFPYLPTNFPNAAICTSSYSSCATEFAKCTYSLESGDSGVTVSGAGVGITKPAAIPDITAASICSSLSTEACHNLQLAGCATYGSAAAQTAGGSFVASTNAAPTGCAGMYGVGMGVGVGVAIGFAGQMVV